MIYQDFELQAVDTRVVKEGGKKHITFRLQVLHSPVGETPDGIPCKVDAAQMRQELQPWEPQTLLQQGPPGWEATICLGEWLSAILFPPPVRELFLSSLERTHANGQGLRLRLMLPRELQNIPWEYALLNQGGGEATITDFLGLMPNLSIVRHQPVALVPWEIKTKGNVRLVMALASPGGHDPLDLGREKSILEKALQRNAHIQPTFIQNATLETLQAELKQAHLFHFAGHGGFLGKDSPPEEIEGNGVIILDDGYGDPLEMSASQLALLLRQAGVRVALLGACQSAQRDAVSMWSSVATALLKVGLGAVVGMQNIILDESAIAFARTFYQALAAGLTIDEAVTNGRIAISHNDVVGWGTPVLYLRTAEGVIFPEYAGNPALEIERSQIRLEVQQWVQTLRGKMTGIKAKTLEKSASVEQKVETVEKDAEMTGIDAEEINADISVNQKADTVNGNVTGIVIDNL